MRGQAKRKVHMHSTERNSAVSDKQNVSDCVNPYSHGFSRYQHDWARCGGTLHRERRTTRFNCSFTSARAASAREDEEGVDDNVLVVDETVRGPSSLRRSLERDLGRCLTGKGERDRRRGGGDRALGAGGERAALEDNGECALGGGDRSLIGRLCSGIYKSRPDRLGEPARRGLDGRLSTLPLGEMGDRALRTGDLERALGGGVKDLLAAT